MLSKTLILAALASVVIAAPTCKPPTPTLPLTGGASELPAPPATLTLKKIAIGHGIQNYTCAGADPTSTATAGGALAVLYDVTNLVPGAPGGMLDVAFTVLSAGILHTVPLPLNMKNPAAANPVGPALPESSYGAVTANPFPAPADLKMGPLTLPFLGVHYFDINGSPTFDLVQKAGLLASVAKKDNVKAPTSADKGLLNTGAVDWLRLLDNQKGISQGLSAVYRVVTAGGAAQACSVSGAGSGSVPYVAQYWMYG